MGEPSRTVNPACVLSELKQIRNWEMQKGVQSMLRDSCTNNNNNSSSSKSKNSSSKNSSNNNNDSNKNTRAHSVAAWKSQR